MYRVVVGLMTSSSREFPRSESDADDSSSRCFNFSSTYCWKETRISRLFSTELPSTVVLKVQRERSGSLSALSSPPWIIWSLSKTRLEKLGWPWRWPLFVDLILAASKHFPSPISSFFSFTNDVAAERWRRSKRFFDNTILFSLTLALSFLFFCRKQDWHGSGSRKRRAGRPSWVKRRRPRHVWPRRRAAFSWTTITRRRISSSCSITICFVVWRRPR